MPKLGRMMVFIDGENLVIRFQEMIAAGRTMRDGLTAYERDIFVWEQGSVFVGLNVVQRATLYTYVQGDQNKVAEIEDRIKELTFINYQRSGTYFNLPNNLTPCVFWKGKNRKSKGVDIQIALDILTHAYQDNVDTILLMSGDGDYLPVLKEAQRLGKTVFVAAFSSGLSPKLRRISDSFHLLDGYYFAERPIANTAPTAAVDE